MTTGSRHQINFIVGPDRSLRALLGITIAFNTIIIPISISAITIVLESTKIATPTIVYETIYTISTTIYGNTLAISAIDNIVKTYPSL